MYLFKLRTWIAIPLLAVGVGLVCKVLDLTTDAALLVGALVGCMLVALTDPVGFGLREDPDVRRRRESGA